jgi:hypothetical protein
VCSSDLRRASQTRQARELAKEVHEPINSDVAPTDKVYPEHPRVLKASENTVS